MEVRYNYNPKYDGIELYFSAAPDLAVRNDLKKNGFR